MRYAQPYSNNMGLESCLIYLTVKSAVSQAEIKDIIENAGAIFLANKSNIDQLDTYRHFYFEIRSDFGLTEVDILLPPGETMITNMSVRFSILSPSSVIDQTFSFLNKLTISQTIKVFDADNNLKELDLNVEEFKLNADKIRKRQIVINNKTGLVIEGGSKTTDYIHSNNLMDKIWGQN